MKKTLSSLFVLAIILFLSSCASVKKVPYFQNIDQVDFEASKGLYDAHIMPKDLLTITVNTVDPAVSAPFNLKGASGQSTDNSSQGYLVDNKGYINFPVIGKIHVAGLTKEQCEDLIKGKLAPYLSAAEKPIVMVRTSSFRITVIGEVGSPGVIPVSTEKMSVIEALAQAGDLTIYGKRDNIILLRENADGGKEYHRLNLNDAEIINSPYYYLQQNDVIYVEPNKVKARNSGIGPSTSLWFSFVGIAASLASLLVTVLK